MTDRIRVADLRALETIKPRDDSLTRYAPYVTVPPDTLTALLDAVEAAHAVRDPDADYTHDEGMYTLVTLDKALDRFEWGAGS